MRIGAAGDTSLAQGAKVWTDPPSDNVVSDTGGFWTIKEGLVPGQYRVLAEVDGVSGRTQRIGLAAGVGSLRVVVMIGDEETTWPPPEGLTRKLPVSTLGPGKNRPGCCNP